MIFLIIAFYFGFIDFKTSEKLNPILGAVLYGVVFFLLAFVMAIFVPNISWVEDREAFQKIKVLKAALSLIALIGTIVFMRLGPPKSTKKRPEKVDKNGED